ncbi:MAG: hypothetical protein EPN91_09410 [Salinibacterium sp.]|nr:MAG: hypothetical protein EPN91_09410 [Salinibacterium sp.]
MAEQRESMRKELPGGALEIVLCCDTELSTEQAALELMRSQIREIRAFADHMEKTVQAWGADLDAGITTQQRRAMNRGQRG